MNGIPSQAGIGLPERIVAWMLTIGALASGLVMLTAVHRVEALWYFGGGIVAGFCGAILGVGGGFFLIPFLVLVMNLPMHVAIATSIISIVATSCAAAPTNFRRGYANLRLGLYLELPTALFAIVGGLLAGHLSERPLTIVFGLAMLVGAYSLWLKARGGPDAASQGDDLGEFGMRYFDPARNEEISYRVRRFPLAMGASTLAGVLSGLLGIGGGIVKVPVMRLFCGIPMKAATATSNYMIGVTAVASAFIYYANGKVAPVIVVGTALGTLGGSVVGTQLTHYLRGRWIQLAFVGMLVIVAFQMLFEMKVHLKGHGVTPDLLADPRWYLVFPGVLRGEWSLLPALGLLLLMFTPAAAVVGAAVGFARERRWRTAAVAAGVVAILITSLITATR